MKNTKLPMSTELYVKHSGNFCPQCGGEDVRATSSMQHDGPTCWQDCACCECPATWQDVYTLASYENLETDNTDQ